MEILVKVPNKTEHKVYSFPFLHCLNEILAKQLKNEEIEYYNIHIISTSDDVDVLNLLPLSAFYHEIDRDDAKNIMGLHRACKNLNLTQNFDLFFSLTNELGDSSIGRQLDVKQSIGFKSLKNNFFLSTKYEWSEGVSLKENQFKLLHIFPSIAEVRKVSSREMGVFYQNWNEDKYIVLNIRNNGKVDDKWIELINLYENQKFVFIDEQFENESDNYEVRQIFENFFEKLSTKNKYIIENVITNITFARLVSYSTLFISYRSKYVEIAKYCGANIVHNFEKSQFTNHIANDNYFSFQNNFDSALDFITLNFTENIKEDFTE